MKELLFGWLTKGQYELTILDSIICILEIFIIPFIIYCIIDFIKEKFRGGKK